LDVDVDANVNVGASGCWNVGLLFMKWPFFYAKLFCCRNQLLRSCEEKTKTAMENEIQKYLAKAASLAKQAGNFSQRITQDLVERSKDVGLPTSLPTMSNIYDIMFVYHIVCA
jgi:hypothetical protein